MFDRALNAPLVVHDNIGNRDHSFSTYAKISEKLTFPTHTLIHTLTCASQGVRNVSFSEKFAHVIHEQCHSLKHKLQTF